MVATLSGLFRFGSGIIDFETLGGTGFMFDEVDGFGLLEEILDDFITGCGKLLFVKCEVFDEDGSILPRYFNCSKKIHQY